MKQLTPKQYAKELVFGFYKIVGLKGFGYDCVPINSLAKYYHKIAQRRSKKCALKCVEELLKSSTIHVKTFNSSKGLHVSYEDSSNYLREVEEEIKKL